MENKQLAPFNKRTKLLLILSRKNINENGVSQKAANTQWVAINKGNNGMDHGNTNLTTSNIDTSVMISDAPSVSTSETCTSSSNNSEFQKQTLMEKYLTQCLLY